MTRSNPNLHHHNKLAEKSITVFLLCCHYTTTPQMGRVGLEPTLVVLQDEGTVIYTSHILKRENKRIQRL